MTNISLSRIFSRAWEVFKTAPLRHVGVFFLWLLLLVFLSAIQQQYHFVGILYFLVAFLGNIFILGYSLDNIRDEFESIGQVFKKYLTWGKILDFFLYMLMVDLIVLVIILAALGLAYQFNGTHSPWVILIIVLASLLLILLSLRLLFAPYLILDKDYNALDAFSESWRTTGPHLGKILLFYLLSFLIVLLGLLVFGVGLLIALPLVYFAQTLLYEYAAGRGEDNEEDMTEI